MGTIVNEIFNRFNLTIHGQVKWNTEIKSDRCGVYVIAITDDRNKLITIENPNFNNSAIKNWIELIKTGNQNLLVDGRPATIELVKQRLSFFAESPASGTLRYREKNSQKLLL